MSAHVGKPLTGQSRSELLAAVEQIR
jgi:hypothetical protein